MLETSIIIVLEVAAVIFASLKFIHMLQLESYQGLSYLRWVRRHIISDVLPHLMIGIVVLLLRVAWVFLHNDYSPYAQAVCYSADGAYILMLIMQGLPQLKKKAKKPLKYTSRVLRLILTLAIATIPFCVGLFIVPDYTTWGKLAAFTLLRYLPGIALPLFIMLPYVLIWPVERGINRWYFNDAKKKLEAREDITKIGITGSFGKTSTKHFLHTILSEKYEALLTPGSFNTPMGVTRTIREQLQDSHKIFIAEMGARHLGDITELCRLVKPQFAIITGIGQQHLETFKTQENIIQTKSELVRALPENGCVFLNGDNQYCRDIYEECTLECKYLYGIDGDGLYMRARDIKTHENGSSFTLEAADGSKARCSTKLLGRHNILNITGAVACAYKLGLSLEQIAIGIAKLISVEHRLQLIPGPVTVIDDAFNSNPEGAKAALDVLAQYKTRKIVVTPGMVELGPDEERANREFGKQIAACADIAILVGKAHVKPIRSGLLEAGFDEGNIVQVESLEKVQEILPKYTVPGCVVLFENDLPDNYNE